jgi:succinoglycan biosynthesis transport protein ExoP
MAEEFDEQPQPELDLSRYWSVLRRRRWYLLLPFFATWLLVWGVSWGMPSVYRSGTLILVQQPAVSKLVGVAADSDLQQRLTSIQQQVLSRTRLLYIIDHLNLYPEQRGRTGPDALVERMRKDIEIELVHSPGGNALTAFNIYFDAKDPHVAQEVTTELTNLLISENLQVGQENDVNTTRFLQSQLEDARKNLADQEAKVRAFKDRHLGELPGQQQSNLQILSGLQGQMQAEEDALGRAAQQRAYLQSLLTQYQSMAQSIGSGNADTVAAGLPAIDQELDRLKAQLADLSSRYTDRHPDVRKVKEQIARTEKMKRQLTAELKAKAASSAGNDASDASDSRETAPIAEVQSQLKGNQIEITNRQHAIASLEQRINEYQGRLNQEPVREQELADLTRDYEQSQANYNSLLAKWNQAELAKNLNKSQEGLQFRMIDPPDLPTKPYSPNRLKLCLGGLFAGLVVGVGVTAGAEFLDDRVYDEKSLAELIPVEVIAEIPPLPTVPEQGSQRRRLWLEFAAVALMSVVALAGLAFTYLRG